MKEFHFLKLTKSFQSFLLDVNNHDVHVDLVIENGVGVFICDKDGDKMDFKFKVKKADPFNINLTEMDFEIENCTNKNFITFESILFLQGNDEIFKITKDAIRSVESIRMERKATLCKRSHEVGSDARVLVRSSKCVERKGNKNTSVNRRGNVMGKKMKCDMTAYNELVRKYDHLQEKYLDRANTRRQLGEDFKSALLLKDTRAIEACLSALETLRRSFTDDDLAEYQGIVALHRQLCKMTKKLALHTQAPVDRCAGVVAER